MKHVNKIILFVFVVVMASCKNYGVVNFPDGSKVGVMECNHYDYECRLNMEKVCEPNITNFLELQRVNEKTIGVFECIEVPKKKTSDILLRVCIDKCMQERRSNVQCESPACTEYQTDYCNTECVNFL